MSLRTQLVATIALVLVATIWLGMLLVHWHAVDKVATEMTASLGVGTRIARNAVGVAELPISDPRRKLELLVSHFDGDRHIKAHVVDTAGGILRSSTPATDPVPAPQWLEHWLAEPPRRVEVALPDIFATHGKLVLETYSKNEIAEVWDDLKVYAKLLAVYGVSGLGVTLLVLTLAMRPLTALNAAISKIGRGDFSTRLDESGPRELASLAHGFNTMTRRLSGAEHRNRELVNHLSRVQEEERAELARNLHDEVSPLLFSVDVDATSIQLAAASGHMDGIAEKARSIQDAAQAMKRNVRGIIEQLRPESADGIDWHSSVQDVVAFWQQRFPTVRFRTRIDDLDAPAVTALALKYVVGEAIGNALKHARPLEIAVTIAAEEGGIAAAIRDDGGGFRPEGDVPSGGSTGGHGIVGMRERVERAGGRFAITALGDPPGVEVRAEFPISSGGNSAVTKGGLST